MTTEALTFPCTQCDGAGMIELDGVHLETLNLLREHDEAHGALLAKKGQCEHSTMNNRLAWLRIHGFATVRKYGRMKFYRAV